MVYGGLLLGLYLVPVLFLEIKKSPYCYFPYHMCILLISKYIRDFHIALCFRGLDPHIGKNLGRQYTIMEWRTGP